MAIVVVEPEVGSVDGHGFKVFFAVSGREGGMYHTMGGSYFECLISWSAAERG